MEINNSFYLQGFRRMDMREAGAVFVRFEAPTAEKSAASIEKAPMYYHGKDNACYMLTVPKPQAEKLTACAVVTRTSKNRYSATAFDETRIQDFYAETLSELQASLNKFFR